jgi:His/Glu/Gln/Arg/opine family amino acid ABC transporter permease subunit
MTARAAPPKTRDWSLRSRAVRALIYQVLALGLVALGVWFLAHNTMENMRVRGIQSGFDFLTGPAGFDIGELLIPYESVDPYWKAFLVGVLNTLRVAIIGIVLTTLLGTLIGVCRFSNNAIVRGLCYAYVELFRNVPVLLQLLVWYLILTEWLPSPESPLSVAGLVFLSKGGLSYPVPVWGLGQGLAAIGLAAGLLVQSLFFAPQDLPQYGMNVTTLLVPLWAISVLAQRIVAPGTAYVDLSYKQALALSTAYQGGIVAWVGFWAFYGDGFTSDNLAAVGSFGLAYMSVILVEPLIDLGMLAGAKALARFSQGPLFNVRLHQVHPSGAHAW